MLLQNFAQYYNRPMMDWGDHGWGVGGMAVCFVVSVLLVGFVIYALKGAPHAHHHAEHEKALDIAKTRYANGEITKQELDQIKKDIV